MVSIRITMLYAYFLTTEERVNDANYRISFIIGRGSLLPKDQK